MNLEGNRILVFTGYKAKAHKLIHLLQDWKGEVETIAYGQALPTQPYKLCFAVLGESNKPKDVCILLNQLSSHSSEKSKSVLLSSKRFSCNYKANWEFNAYLRAPLDKDSLHVVLTYLLSEHKMNTISISKSNLQLSPLRANTQYFKEVAPTNKQLQRKLILLCLENICYILENLPNFIEQEDTKTIQQMLHRLKYYYACLGRVDMNELFSKFKRCILKDISSKRIGRIYDKLWRESHQIIAQLLVSEDL